jgi:hypothetical protein
MAKRKNNPPVEEKILTFEEKREFIHSFLNKNRRLINASKIEQYTGLNPVFSFSTYKLHNIAVFKAYVEPIYGLFSDFLKIGETREEVRTHFCKYFDLLVKKRIYDSIGIYKMQVSRHMETKEAFFDKIMDEQRVQNYVSLIKSMKF